MAERDDAERATIDDESLREASGGAAARTTHATAHPLLGAHSIAANLSNLSNLSMWTSLPRRRSNRRASDGLGDLRGD